MSFNRAGHRAELNHVKSKIARALTEAGEQSYGHETVEALSVRASRVFGPRLPGERTIEYFYRVSGKTPKRASSGQVALPNQFRPMQRREIEPSRIPHLRQAEIDAQPTLVNMPWDGTGVSWDGTGVSWQQGAWW